MSDFETHGNGFSGRVDGPLFDARHALMPASMILGTVGEAVQNEAQQYQADGVPMPEMHGFVGKAYELMATMPLDAKALGLGCAAAAAVTMVHAGRAMRDIAVENSIIDAGLDRASAVEPLHRRALKRAGAIAVAGLAAFGAYKTGEHMSATADLAADLGVMGTGVAYLMYMRKRMTGRW